MILRLAGLRVSICSSKFQWMSTSANKVLSLDLNLMTFPQQVNILEHSEYFSMQEELYSSKKNPGPVDAVCKFILKEGLCVNEQILNLNAIGLFNHAAFYNNRIKVLKEEGRIKSGGFTRDFDTTLKEKFSDLVTVSQVNREDLNKTLFDFEFRQGELADRKFALQRQLVGFYLLQALKDGDQRLPVEVYCRLATILFSGPFTKKEDAAILTWVETNGLSRWRELASFLGRTYPSGGVSVRRRYEIMMSRKKGERSGSFDENELFEVIKHVLYQSLEAIDEVQRNSIDWKATGEVVNRHWTSVWKVFQNSIQPTIRRHLAGTLEDDVRGQLIKKAKEKDWNTQVHMDFHQLAEMSEFRGHTSHSLKQLHDSMLGDIVEKRNDLKSKREVTLDMVEQWFANTTRRKKSSRLKAKEQAVVSAYKKVIETMHREQQFLNLQEKYTGKTIY